MEATSKLQPSGPCPRCGKEWRDCPCGKVDIFTGNPCICQQLDPDGSCASEDECPLYRDPLEDEAHDPHGREELEDAL